MRYGTSPEQADEEETELLVERVRRLVAEFYRTNPDEAGACPECVTVISRTGAAPEAPRCGHDR